jgi:hypothetical protein
VIVSNFLFLRLDALEQGRCECKQLVASNHSIYLIVVQCKYLVLESFLTSVHPLASTLDQEALALLYIEKSQYARLRPYKVSKVVTPIRLQVLP